MQHKERLVSLDTVERERERERATSSEVSFIFDAQNNIDEKIRIDYKVKININKMEFYRSSLSFLRACEVVENKDKYAWVKKNLFLGTEEKNKI